MVRRFSWALLGLLASGACEAQQEANTDVSDTCSMLQQHPELFSHAPHHGPQRAPVALELAQTRAGVEVSSTAAATPTTTINPTGLTLNGAGDLEAFVSAAFSNIIFILVVLCIFMKLRVHYPLMYSGNVCKGHAPSQPDITSHFSWITASLSATQQELIDSVGLDRAMLLHFPVVCMKICAIVGLPMFFILGPMHCFFGGHSAGQDHLSYFSAGNVKQGSWLYSLHCVVVWGVVVAVTRIVHVEMERFMKLRWAWLRGMAPTRACTVLVSGIPDEFQSDAKLKAFFKDMFPGDKVAEAYCTRDTSELCALREQLANAKAGLHEAGVLKEKDPSNAPQVHNGWFGARVDAEEHYKALIADLEPRVAASRKAIAEASATPGWQGLHCSTGFVTFRARGDAEVAKRMLDISSDQDEWVIEEPPVASDVLWPDLTQDPTAQAGREIVGYLCVAGLYFAYMPLVIGLTNLANLIDLGPLQPLWAGIAPSFGVTFMVSFLPTFIIWIFKLFFTLRAEAWAQHRLQNWYFWFQVVFVVLAAAVGHNCREFTAGLVQNPLSLPEQLATTLPSSTHFYMNFIMVQWGTHTTNMLRYVNLSKYLSFSLLYKEDEAADKAEPEDQEYYGIGSRSARWTTNMVIGIVYGTLSPPMYILTFMNFALTSLLYGYLIPFAETKKPDLGGVLFVSQLRHLHHALIIYVVLMTGIAMHRASHIAPAVVSGLALIYISSALKRFDKHFSWERLPFQELMSDEGRASDAKIAKRADTASYRQPELQEGS